MLALGWGVFSFSLLQVVGSQARILYSDQKGRMAIAVAINQAIASGKIKVSETACGASRRLHRHLFTQALLGGLPKSDLRLTLKSALPTSSTF